MWLDFLVFLWLPFLSDVGLTDWTWSTGDVGMRVSLDGALSAIRIADW